VTISPGSGRLTSRQYALAVRAVRRAVDVERAHLVSATAVLRPGPVRHPNLGGLCRSGRLLKIRLTGRFPHIGVHRLPRAPSGLVTSVQITADGTSGRACRLDVGVGEPLPPPYHRGADLLPALTGQSRP
jgi:hypothetical protein